MGIANVIPGVSGGTIAIIFNIYDELMECITINIKTIFKHLNFLIPLGIGMICGIIGLSKLMEILFDNFPTQTYFAFIGIIIGSLPLMFSKVKANGKIDLKSIISFLIMFSIMILTTYTKTDKEAGEVLFTTLNFNSFLILFFSMALASATMIIPGVSGSMLLIVLGMYKTIMFEVINNRNIPLLIPSALGGIVGILLGAKLIRVLLEKFPKITYMGIIGLLIGSAYQLVYQSGINFDFNLFISILIMCLMAVIIYLFSLSEIKGE